MTQMHTLETWESQEKVQETLHVCQKSSYTSWPITGQGFIQPKMNLKRHQIWISQSAAYDNLMVRVKNPTVNKQTKKNQTSTNQQSACKVFIFAHLNVIILTIGYTLHSDVIDVHSLHWL